MLPMRTTAVLLALASALAFAQSKPAAQDEAAKAAIRDVLSRQVDAWNAHNLEAFMAGYWHSPELSFFSGPNITRGWEKTLERYRQRYQSEGREMGKLDFFDLEINILAPDAAVVYGHYRLTMSNSQQNNSGIYTLIFRKFPDGWKIVHDHTSS